MLQALTIDNYALIDHLTLAPCQGLNVITGETGAGKSIIMGALGLILGARADSKAVRTDATKCVIEATFDISRYQLQTFFAENDLEYDAHATIIRREIYSTGKSRAFINDIPVQLTMLKTLGDALIDIHSQHQNLLLGKDTFQQEVLDTLAGNSYELGQYRSSYKEMQAIRRQIKQLREEAERNAQEADYIRYQWAKLDEAHLTEGEQETLEAEQELLSHAEEIKGGLTEIHEGLDGDGESAVVILKQMAHKAQALTSVYPELEEIAQRLESDYIDLKDIAEEVDEKAENVNFDPERFQFVEERLSLIYQLEKKHGVETVEELIAIRDELDTKMQHIDGSDEEIEALEEQNKQLTAQTVKCAAALTASRKRAAKEFEKALIEKVAYLGMPNVRFEAQIKPLGNGETEKFSINGADQITFLFSANKNQPLKPAGEVASGGEISRLMLSIKALVASAKTLPTIIFDEIDTGVSGDIADRMGQVMKELSQNLQVITITHLPQVAGKGDMHLKVYKEDDEKTTTTHIVTLNDEERVQEIARMLSGSNITEAAIQNAKELIG